MIGAIDSGSGGDGRGPGGSRGRGNGWTRTIDRWHRFDAGICNLFLMVSIFRCL